jgi:hypothetical protein
MRPPLHAYTRTSPYIAHYKILIATYYLTCNTLETKPNFVTTCCM